jgi:hypothetical protein
VQNHGHTSAESYARAHIVQTNSLNPQSTIRAKSETSDFYSASVLLRPVVIDISFTCQLGPEIEIFHTALYSIFMTCLETMLGTDFLSEMCKVMVTPVALSILQLVGRKTQTQSENNSFFHLKIKKL